MDTLKIKRNTRRTGSTTAPIACRLAIEDAIRFNAILSQTTMTKSELGAACIKFAIQRIEFVED